MFWYEGVRFWIVTLRRQSSHPQSLPCTCSYTSLPGPNPVNAQQSICILSALISGFLQPEKHLCFSTQTAEQLVSQKGEGGGCCPPRPSWAVLESQPPVVPSFPPHLWHQSEVQTWPWPTPILLAHSNPRGQLSTLPFCTLEEQWDGLLRLSKGWIARSHFER